MSKRQKSAFLAKALPYLRTAKQRLALFTAMLLLSLMAIEFDSPHIHVEPENNMATVTVPFSASGNSTAQTITSSWLPRNL
jgi:hypothetical protein